LLETGYLQPEAIALYEWLGYSRRGPFGPYTEDPNRLFMHKSASGPIRWWFRRCSSQSSVRPSQLPWLSGVNDLDRW